MGAFGDAFAAFAQPLIDQTDGSPEELQRALHLSQLCYNTALLPADKREELLAEFRSTLEMGEDEFNDFRRSVLEPMIARHEEMFPMLHQRRRASSSVLPRGWLGGFFCKPPLCSSDLGHGLTQNAGSKRQPNQAA